MIDRESIFSDSEIIELLKTKFVPLAVDQHIERRRRDVEGEFFRKILAQAGRRPNGYAQGLYVFSADGTLLGYSNTLDGRSAKRLMRAALEKFDPKVESPPIDPHPEKDTRVVHDVPEDVTVIDVTSKVIGGFQLVGRRSRGRQAITAKALGRDRLWIRGEETEALARNEFPHELIARIAKYHLVDNTRGEPLFWEDRDIRELDITFEDGRLTGHVHLETGDGKKGYIADLRGIVEAKENQLAKFDLVALGDFWGRGTVTDRRPSGEKYELGVSFRVSYLKCEASRIAPGACRGGTKEYFGK